MRLGLIARCDARGIAWQTHEVYRNLHPHRTLVLMLHDKAWPENPALYSGRRVDYATVNRDTREIPDHKGRLLLSDIDVLFAVETAMDWRLVRDAAIMGVRTVIQGNPEFYVHHRRDWPHPDVWAWPTGWMREHLPDGPTLPVPVPDRPPVAAGDPAGDGPLRVLHVAGHAAAGDRNGTREFMGALTHIRTPVRVTVVGQDGWLPDTKPSRHVELIINPNGVEDRWEMYAGQHVVVLPRKYGGLCLPANEACAVGCAIVMPDCEPNPASWPSMVPIPARKGRLHNAPFGPVQTWAVSPNQIAHAIDKLNRRRDDLALAMAGSRAWAARNTWRALRPLYEEVLAP